MISRRLFHTFIVFKYRDNTHWDRDSDVSIGTTKILPKKKLLRNGLNFCEELSIVMATTYLRYTPHTV
jgi:hypothetical protein